MRTLEFSKKESIQHVILLVFAEQLETINETIFTVNSFCPAVVYCARN